MTPRPFRAFRRRRQCAACPWKVATDPRSIPGGYDPEKHRRLAACQSEGAASLVNNAPGMACHESPPDDEYACVGWLVHQLGPGNNLRLRMLQIRRMIPHELQVDGPQHPSVEAMCAAAPASIDQEESDGGSAVGSAGPAAE